MSVEPPKERILQELGNNQNDKQGIRAIPREKATNFQKFVGKLLGTAVTYNDKEYILKFSSVQKFRANHKEHKALFVRGFVKNVMNFSTEAKSYSQKVLSQGKCNYGELFLQLGYHESSIEGAGQVSPVNNENPITWLKSKLEKDSKTMPKAKQFLDVLKQQQEQHILQAAEKLDVQGKMNQNELTDLARLLEISDEERDTLISACRENNNHLRDEKIYTLLEGDKNTGHADRITNVFRFGVKKHGFEFEEIFDAYVGKSDAEKETLRQLSKLDNRFLLSNPSTHPVSSAVGVAQDEFDFNSAFKLEQYTGNCLVTIHHQLSRLEQKYPNNVDIKKKIAELKKKCEDIQGNIESLVTVLNSKNQNISKDSLGKLLHALGIEEKGRTSALQAWDENKAPADQKEQFIEILKKIQGWENTLIGVMTIQALSLQNK